MQENKTYDTITKMLIFEAFLSYNLHCRATNNAKFINKAEFLSHLT